MGAERMGRLIKACSHEQPGRWHGRRRVGRSDPKDKPFAIPKQSARSREPNGWARASHVTSGDSSLPGRTWRTIRTPAGPPTARRCCTKRACQRVRRRWRAPGIGQTGRFGRGRRRDHHPAGAPLPGRHRGGTGRGTVTAVDSNTVRRTGSDQPREVQGSGTPGKPARQSP
jgi:hypothetical protein